MPKPVTAIVVGAGPAGLATSRELTRAGVQHRVLEGGEQVGQTWARLYDSLVLHTGRHLSALPGLRLSSSLPIFVPRRDFLEYLHRYAATLRLPIETGAEVTSAARDDGQWCLRLRSGEAVYALHLIVATGIVANPYVPAIAGRDRFGGRLIHSVEYRRPDAPDLMNGKRILVVGAGNSAGEISVELARAGAEVSLAVRTGAVIVPRDVLGIPTQYLSVMLSPLPRAIVQRLTAIVGRLRGPRVMPPPGRTPCPKVPLIGLALAEALRAGRIRLRGGVEAFTSGGARFDDGSEQGFDEVILATGYRAAVGFLGGAIRLDACGFARRRDRVTSADRPGLYFVGHNYDARGALFNIARDARHAVRALTTRRCDTGRTSIETRPAPSER
jgi:cation diffusion facilitator CzcD-associated flavoprotein CzcO